MNHYDDVKLNVEKLLQTQRAATTPDPHSHSGQDLTPIQLVESILARYSTAALYRSGLWRRLIYTHLKLDWFFEFRDYWINELGLRRIEPHDFHYLHSVYRKKFQQLSVEDSATHDQFLTAWQDPSTLYLLFAYQYKLALHPLSAYTLAKYIPRRADVLEYGCGLAPITKSLANFYPNKKLRLTAADIPSHMLHFVGWRHRNQPFIDTLSLNPADNTPLTDTYDAIACMTVFEHLPHPLPIVKHLHAQLNPDGIFMFDYIKSEGTGLDTASALRDRQQVLAFITKHFTILRGSIPTDGSNVKAVICKKK